MSAVGLLINIGSRLKRKKKHGVRTLEPASRLVATDVERFVENQLAGATSVAYEKLVSRVAEFIYRKELKLGASVLDIGLFGSSLFVAEARRELELGRGKLWEINQEKASVELISNRSGTEAQILSGASRSQRC